MAQPWSQSDIALNIRHDAQAARRLPGPDYYEVLRWIHEELEPSNYVEIGIFNGRSLALARRPTTVIGVDPDPCIEYNFEAETLIFSVTSDEFFASQNLMKLFGGRRTALAFIDGLHLFEQVHSDFCNLEKYVSAQSIIMLHDTIPLSERTASRNRKTMFYTGDVWKMLPWLQRSRPELQVITIEAPPSGLTLVRGFTRRAHPDDCSAELIPLPFAYHVAHRSEYLRTIPNKPADVIRWLRKG